jgi:hypothetical protein
LAVIASAQALTGPAEGCRGSTGPLRAGYIARRSIIRFVDAFMSNERSGQ